MIHYLPIVSQYVVGIDIGYIVNMLIVSVFMMFNDDVLWIGHDNRICMLVLQYVVCVLTGICMLIGCRLIELIIL